MVWQVARQEERLEGRLEERLLLPAQVDLAVRIEQPAERLRDHHEALALGAETLEPRRFVDGRPGGGREVGQRGTHPDRVLAAAVVARNRAACARGLEGRAAMVADEDPDFGRIMLGQRAYVSLAHELLGSGDQNTERERSSRLSHCSSRAPDPSTQQVVVTSSREVHFP